MDYDQYKERFKGFEGRGSVEAHIAFKINEDSPNPNYPEYMAAQIEREVAGWLEKASPGIKCDREGLSFTLDLIAYKRSDHLDYFDRALTMFRLRASAHYIDPVPNRLNEGR